MRPVKAFRKTAPTLTCRGRFCCRMLGGFQAQKAHDVKGPVKDRVGNCLGLVRPFRKNAVDLCRIVHQAFHLGRDWRQMFDSELRQGGFEFAPALTAIFCQNLFAGHIGEGGINVDEVAGLGTVGQAFHFLRQDFGVGFRLLEFLGDGVGNRRSC